MRLIQFIQTNYLQGNLSQTVQLLAFSNLKCLFSANSLRGRFASSAPLYS